MKILLSSLALCASILIGEQLGHFAAYQIYFKVQAPSLVRA